LAPETIEMSFDVAAEEAVAILAQHAQKSSWEHVKLDLLSTDPFFRLHVKPNGRFKIQAAGGRDCDAPLLFWRARWFCGLWFALKGRIAASETGSVLKGRIVHSTLMLFVRGLVTFGVLGTGLPLAWSGEVRILLVLLLMVAVFCVPLHLLHRSCRGRAARLYVRFLRSVYGDAPEPARTAGRSKGSGGTTA